MKQQREVVAGTHKTWVLALLALEERHCVQPKTL